MTNTIQHVGVKGMRWGHRKAYVPTPEQIANSNRVLNDPNSSKEDREKALREIGIDSKGKRIKVDSRSEDAKTAVALKKKSLEEMTNAELKTLAARMQLETQVKDLSRKQLSPAAKLVEETLVGIGKDMLTEALKKGLNTGKDKLIDILQAKIRERAARLAGG